MTEFYFEFKKLIIVHNSLNNGVSAVLTQFLEFQFFGTFLPETLFSGGNNRPYSLESYQTRVNLIK